MLSLHELVIAIKTMYPKVQKLEGQVLNLFNKVYQPGRGPTGLTGSNEIEWTIDYLESTKNMLIRMKQNFDL